MFDFVCLAAGATLRAAQALVQEESKIAINWCGGWHHAKRYSNKVLVIFSRSCTNMLSRNTEALNHIEETFLAVS